jgi:hypothetical protein
MKPRSQSEVADYVRKSLEQFEGKALNQKELTEHLTKVLGELFDRRRKPSFELKVQHVGDDGRLTVEFTVNDPRLADQLIDSLGRPCKTCKGRGMYRESNGLDTDTYVCETCKGRGIVPL